MINVALNIKPPWEREGGGEPPRRPGEWQVKSFPARVTKVDANMGIVTAVVNVFGIIDEGEDNVQLGAFTKTITERAARIKVLDNHRTDSVLRVVGKPLSLREIGREELPVELKAEYPEATGGLETVTQYAINTPEGYGVFQRIAGEYVTEYSIGFEVIQSNYQRLKESGRTIRVIKEIRLWEYSPVIWGMNAHTYTADVKAAGSPPEAKPVDETEDNIRVRIFNPDLCQAGSFRTQAFSAEQGIQAVLCRKSEESKMSIQSMLFAKSKGWTAAKAQAWVREHNIGKAAGDSDLETKQPMPGEPMQTMGQYFKAKVMDAYMACCQMCYGQGMMDDTEYQTMCTMASKLMETVKGNMPAGMHDRPMMRMGGRIGMYSQEPLSADWEGDEAADDTELTYVMLLDTLTEDIKAGRVLSARIAGKIIAAVEQLQEVLRAAGVYATVEEEQEEVAGSSAGKAGSPARTPTREERDALLRAIEEASRELTEVDDVHDTVGRPGSGGEARP